MKKIYYEYLELPAIYFQEEIITKINEFGETVRQPFVHRIVTRAFIDPIDIEFVSGSSGYSDKERALQMKCSRLWMKSGHAIEIDMTEAEMTERWITAKQNNDKMNLIFKMN